MYKLIPFALIATTMALAAGKTQTEEECCERSQLKRMRVSARHIEPGGIGYNQGYTTIEGFFAHDPSSYKTVPFLDVRGHVFNDGNFAANAGLGARRMWGCRSYGINSYYDYRQTNKFHYNQVALGFETLGELWDIRLNGYLPVGRKKSKGFDEKFSHFSQHSIFLSQKFEFGMKGADAEMGFHFGKTKNFDFWAAGGPYYFIGPLGGPMWGGKARIGGMFRQYLTFEFFNSLDNKFHYRPQGQITLSYPFGGNVKRKQGECCACSIYDRMVQRVDRQEIVVVSRKKTKSVAINPATGQPYFAWFVDNQSSSAGTFQSPFPTLALAQSSSSPGDIIYVFPGDGTTNGMNSGIALQTNQKFWGSGVGHDLVTTLGTIAIPAQTAATPLMTNTSGSGITLASGNDVAGFFVSRPKLQGITGTNVNQITLEDMTLFAAQGGANGNGINIIENNGGNYTLSFKRLNIFDNTNNGIYIEIDNSTSANVSIMDSNIFTNGNGFSDNGIVLNSNGASNLVGLLQNNNVQNNAINGIVLDSTSNGLLNFTLNNNLIEAHLGGAISGQFTGTASTTIVLNGNTIIGNQGVPSLPGHNVIALNFGGPATLTALGNQMDHNGGGFSSGNGIFNVTAGVAPLIGTISGNSINRNGDTGLSIVVTGTELLSLLVTENDISGNCNEGIAFKPSTAAANLFLSLFDNTINGNCNVGIGISPSAIGTLSFFANNNEITGNCAPGIEIGAATISDLEIFLNGNTINGNCGQAVALLTGSTVSTLSLIFNENTFNGNCGSALVVSPTAISSIVVSANDNEIAGNSTGFGLNLNTLSADTSIAISNNLIKDTQGNGIAITSAPTGAANWNVTLSNNQILSNYSSALAQGITVTNSGTNTGSNTFIATNNIVSSNTNNGIFLRCSAGAPNGSMTIDISGNTCNFNQDNGINLATNMSNPFTFHTTISNNTAQFNALNGIVVNGSGSESFNIHMDGNNLFDNGAFSLFDLQVINAGSAQICLEMSGNTSNVGYKLAQGGGAFNLAPNGVAGASAVNVGTFTTSGTIGSVPSCGP